jgi:hypothetical protein
MRIALCLSGYFSSLKDTSSLGEDGYAYIQKHIFKYREEGHEIDVFLHNWEPQLKEVLIKLYAPKKYIIEPQINFDTIADEHKISRRFLDPRGALGSWTINSSRGSGYVGPERILSQYYSIQRSFELKKQYEEENNFKYDCVIKSRFDLGRINRNTSGPGNNNAWPCQCIDFNPDYDMSKFYQVYWDLFNEGPADMWFYSNSENMDCFAHLYDKALTEYLQLGSDYAAAVTTGWPESSAGQYRTNELLKPPEKRATNLHKYPPHMVVNAILLMKWFLIDHGQWENSELLKTEWE